MPDDNQSGEQKWIAPDEAPIVAEGARIWNIAGGDNDRFFALLNERLKRDRAFQRAFREWSVQTYRFSVTERIRSSLLGIE